MANNKLVTVDVLAYNNEKIKEQLNKKIDAQQDVADANKILGIGVDGVVTPIEAPSSVKVSAETDNQIEQKQDGIYVKDMSAKISAETDNAIEIKDDGLYVPTVSETKVSSEENNIIVSKDDGLYAEDAIVEILIDGNAVQITDKKADIALKTVNDLENYYLKTETYSAEEIDDLLSAITTLTLEVVTVLPTTDISTTKIYLVPKTETEEQDIYLEYINLDGTENGYECIGSTKVDLTNFYTKEETENLIKDELYIENTISAHYELADSTTTDALEVVADGTATDGQIDLSNVADIGANVGDFVVFVDEVTTIDTKYAEKADTYTKSEVDQKITDAVTSGTVDLSGYTTDDELSTALADYTKTTDLETQLEDYVLDSDMEIIDLATLESMLGLSTEELEGLASLLSDQTIELSKTWSSSCIYGKLNETLDSAKQYTLDELAKSIGASYKVVDSVDSMTSAKVLYLLKDTDSGLYNIYIYDADTSTAELIGSFEINLDDYLKISDAEAQYVKQTDLVANYATKQELTDAIADVEVEVSQETNNLLENRDDGLYVGSGDVVISKADYDALDEETRNNGQTYFIYDDETTEDGTDLSQFAKVSNLEDGTITVGNSKKLNGLTKDELFADTNSKIKEINNNLAQLIKTTTVTASADIAANSSAFISVSPPETPSGYRRLFDFIQGGSGSMDTSQLLVGSGTNGCRVYNNLPQKQTVTIECRIVYIKNC